MSEPRRLLDRPASADVRRALVAGLGMNPPARAERRVWAALSSAIAASGGSLAPSAALGVKGSAATSASASSATGIGIGAVVKCLAIGVGAGAIGLGAQRAWTSTASRPTAPMTAPAPSPERPELPALVTSVSPSATALTELPAPPSLPATPRPRPARPASHPPDESAMVLDARDALRRGDPTQALAILRRAPTSVAGGLVQERRVLEIEALVLSGARDEASQRARDFVESYPHSPYVARIRSLIP